VKRLEAVSFVGESRAVVKLVGIEISRSLDKISVNEGYSVQTLLLCYRNGSALSLAAVVVGRSCAMEE
jgi:hypothetical protein